MKKVKKSARSKRSRKRSATKDLSPRKAGRVKGGIDVNIDGTPDIIVGAGAGATGGHVRV